MGWFGKRKTEQVDIQECVRLVRTVLANIGIKGEPQPVDGGAGLGWVIQRGSAVVYVMIGGGDNNSAGYLKVISPILFLPGENLLPLYRTLLEINMELTSAALGIQQDKVCVISERSIAGLNAEEADEIIKRVAHYADQLDDQLAAEFGARLVTKA
jgi:hypothetical protein